MESMMNTARGTSESDYVVMHTTEKRLFSCGREKKKKVKVHHGWGTKDLALAASQHLVLSED